MHIAITTFLVGTIKKGGTLQHDQPLTCPLYTVLCLALASHWYMSRFCLLVITLRFLAVQSVSVRLRWPAWYLYWPGLCSLWKVDQERLRGLPKHQATNRCQYRDFPAAFAFSQCLPPLVLVVGPEDAPAAATADDCGLATTTANTPTKHGPSPAGK